MLKKIMLVTMAIFMLLMTAGCGDDFKGDWMRTIRNGNETKFHILHLSKADTGGYVLEQEFKTFKKTNAKGYIAVPASRTGKDVRNVSTGDGDGILNTEEVFTWKREWLAVWATPTWNGKPLKLVRQYEYNETVMSDVYQFKKEELALKDGKLVLGGRIYEKTDKAKVDKLIADYKANLKKQIGTETTVEVSGCKQNPLKAVLSKIVIVTNGKPEEVLE